MSMHFGSKSYTIELKPNYVIANTYLGYSCVSNRSLRQLDRRMHTQERIHTLDKIFGHVERASISKVSRLADANQREQRTLSRSTIFCYSEFNSN